MQPSVCLPLDCVLKLSEDTVCWQTVPPKVRYRERGPCSGCERQDFPEGTLLEVEDHERENQQDRKAFLESFSFFGSVFEAGSQVAQDGFELLILLFQPPEYWD